MFEIIFLIAIAGYFLQTFLFVIGIRKKFPKINMDKLPTASIIIAARNEEQNIIRCLNSLAELDYPEDKLEIILVDDKSTDKTGQLIDEFIKEKPKFKKIITKKEIGKLKGKTNALANALEIANGEIILTTDADCVVKPSWVKTVTSYYHEDVAIVNGFTTQESYNGFSGMQALDFIYLLIVASGTTNLGYPISCIGNNMSYRKKAYKEVGGYENLPFSVTEDFNLLMAITRLKKYKIIFPLDKDALVISEPCKNFKELFQQKKRWGVGGLEAPVGGYFVMANGFIAHMCILLLPFFFSTIGLTLTIFKLALDILLFYPVLKELKLKNKLKYFLSFELYFIIYVAALPFVLLTSRKVVWKGRNY